MATPPGTSDPAPLFFVLDFDGTITKKDTISVLAEIAITHQKTLGLDKQQEWNSLLKAYTDDLTTYKQAFPNQTCGSLIRTPSESTCLSNLKAVEYASISRVNASHIFQGLNQDILLQGARNAVLNGKVSVRDGFKEFIERVRELDGGKVAVASVHWSDEWIQAVLVAGGVFEAIDDIRSHVPIASNRIDYDSGEILGHGLEMRRVQFPGGSGSGRSPGQKRGSGSESETKMEKKNLLTTADEKLNAVKILYSHYQYTTSTNQNIAPTSQNQNPATRVKPKLIYIGDSPTDLDSLLVADIAIVMVSDSTGALKEDLQRLGWEWRFIGKWTGEGDMEGWLEKRWKGGNRGKGKEKVVFWAEGWRDILGCGVLR